MRAKPQESDMMKFKDIIDYAVNIDDFREMGSLGQGSFGKVWKGQSRTTGWTVAVKELLPNRMNGQDLEFYKREVEILIHCKDPFLLDFVGFTISPPYSIVTSFMPRGSLWDAIHNKEIPLDATQKTNIAMGIAHGMLYLHRHKIVHRDLKSPNILLDERLLPKIADFGLGKMMTGFEDLHRLTGNLGTPIWMAPEILMDIPYGPPVDVYAYGMILYEMYMELVPFNGLEHTRILKVVVQDGNRPELRDPTSSIAQLIQECWDGDALNRPTFEQVYSRFANGSVSFPGAKPAGTKILVHEVQQEESSVVTSVLDLAAEMNQLIGMRKTKPDKQQLQDRLCELAAAGDVVQLNMVLTAYVGEADVNGRDAHGVPPIHAAIGAGHLIVVEYIAKLRHSDKNAGDNDGNTPLMAAVKGGWQRIVGFLVKCEGVDVNAQNNFGWTALHIAGMLQPVWRDATMSLLARSAEVRVDLEDWEGKTPFASNPQLGAVFQAKQQEYASKR
jgi:hypothetical protein